MKLPSLSGILKKPSYMVILSLLIAVLAWFVVINTAPDQERLVTVKNIPVNTTAATTALRTQDYETLADGASQGWTITQGAGMNLIRT